MAINSEFWTGRRVLLTGHTGFKGAWLSLWLQSLGAHVSGLAPGPPTQPSVYQLADVGAHMRERAVDVRDAAALRAEVRAASPEVVLHLAAQPMVRRSLLDPVLTYEVNVLGTVNLLDAVRREGTDVRAVVVVTSDKCYENVHAGPSGRERAPAPRRFREGDRLGGADPYSSSKACAELIAEAYRRSFFAAESGPQVATARAGNVIGGGDWGEDRLLGDALRALACSRPLRVRNPDAVRPWQHVLNPLAGYLLLAERLCESAAAARAWNFGPRERDERTVAWLLERLRELWGGALRWELDEAPNPPEATHLALDSSAAERELGWRPGWSLEEGLRRIVAWHRALEQERDMRAVSMAQIECFARDLGEDRP